MRLVTFDTVHEKINSHTKVSRRRLLSILARMILIASGISFFLDSLLFASVQPINSIYLLAVFIIAYFTVFMTLDCMSKSKEVYETVIRWKGVMSWLSTGLSLFGCFILLAF